MTWASATIEQSPSAEVKEWSCVGCIFNNCFNEPEFAASMCAECENGNQLRKKEIEAKRKKYETRHTKVDS